MATNRRQESELRRLKGELALWKGKETLSKRLTADNVNLRAQLRQEKEARTKAEEARTQAEEARRRAEQASRAKDEELRALREKIDADARTAETQRAEAESERARLRHSRDEAAAYGRQMKEAYERLRARQDNRRTEVENATLHIKCEGGRMVEYRLEHMDDEESFQCYVSRDSSCLHVYLATTGTLRVRAKNMKCRS